MKETNCPGIESDPEPCWTLLNTCLMFCLLISEELRAYQEHLKAEI